MSTELQDPPEQTAASLLTGILGDLHHLVEQQFQLTRREIEEELGRRATAMAIFGVGMGFLFLAAIALCLTLTHLLHWVASPPGTDPAWLPLWACHGMVAAGLVALGGILVQVGRAKFRSIDPFQNPATEIAQEYVP
jgi:MFS family permease